LILLVVVMVCLEALQLGRAGFAEDATRREEEAGVSV
jgi:hypothetical protein